MRGHVKCVEPGWGNAFASWGSCPEQWSEVVSWSEMRLGRDREQRLNPGQHPANPTSSKPAYLRRDRA